MTQKWALKTFQKITIAVEKKLTKARIVMFVTAELNKH